MRGEERRAGEERRGEERGGEGIRGTEAHIPDFLYNII